MDFLLRHIEPVAVVFGIVSVYLSVRENIWSWPTAIVNVGLYILVFFEAKLYADMGLQVIYVALSCYGWYEWLYGGENRQKLHVTRTPARLGLLLGLVGAAFAAVLGTVLDRYTDAALPYVDSTLSSFSLVAQFMMSRKYLENWLLWVALDVAYIAMFITKKLYLTSGLYAVFLVLAAMGYVQWRRSLQARLATAQPAVAA